MLPPYYFYWFRIDNKHVTESWLDQALIDLAYMSDAKIGTVLMFSTNKRVYFLYVQVTFVEKPYWKTISFKI